MVQSSNAQRRAFTLIELLVVIAIIAILAAILFPVFAQAKDAAKKTQSLSNVKQISTALQLYANDADDSYPAWSEYYAISGNQGTSGAPGPMFGVAPGLDSKDRYWDAKLSPYVKNGNPALGDYSGMWFSPNSQKDSKSRSYGVGYYFAYAQDPNDPWGYRWLNASKVVNSASTVWMGESGTGGMMSRQVNYDAYYQKYIVPSTYTREAPDRYAGGSNYAYLDGHAKSAPRAKYWAWPVPKQTNYSAYNGLNYCIAANYFAPAAGEKERLRVLSVAAGYNCVVETN